MNQNLLFFSILCCIFGHTQLSWGIEATSGITASSGTAPSKEDTTTTATADPAKETTLTVHQYCAQFAEQYTKDPAIIVEPASAVLVERQKSPSDDIAHSYTCQFQIQNAQEEQDTIFVTIFLVSDPQFARIIREPRWYIIPMSYIKGEGPTNGATQAATQAAQATQATQQATQQANQPSQTDSPLVTGANIEGWGIFMSHAKSPMAELILPPADILSGRSPLEACQSFASQYANNRSLALVPRSVFVKVENLKDKIIKWMSNIFQPEGSRFLIGYQCHFKLAHPEGQESSSEPPPIYLLLVETYHFATHTQDTQWQLIPIEYVKDLANEKQGFTVFKHLP